MHGYSSSEESDDPRRPRSQPASSGNNQDQKKKRKKRLPPQQSINKVWKKFSNRKFHKALSVLPFDPVVAPRSGLDRPNELISEGYEKAAEECRRKVQKIVKECKRVNMRYRDPGWDLDWDLKYEKGNTLNYIGTNKFEVSRSTLLGSKAVVPKAVKRVHEIFDKPTFMGNVDGSDVKQGGLGDCWLMSSLTALASVKDGVKRCCVAYDTKVGIYGFVFYRDGEWVYSIVDDKLYLKSPCWDSPSMQRDLLQQIDREDVEAVYRKTYQTGSKALFFAQCKDQNETWVPLLEKAYAKAHGDYASLSGGWIGEGLEDLSGGVTTELLTSDILDLDEFWDNEMSKVNKEFMFGCSTGLLDYGYGQRDGISEAHAYVVTDARTLKSGQRLVKLRNPWGEIRKGLWEGPWSDGSKEWTTEVQEELGHKFGSDSVFWISFEDLVRKYTHFDRTRLFRDPDWRCCQRWIGVDVPWKAEYHEKFRIKLTKDSPLILVLSQLDGRYFKGLQGQYSFRLHFRLHYEDRPDAEDYIVRSHGNYFMKRSVSVELPDLPSGNYTVYLKVTGQRDQEQPSVEEVVKRESQGRVENEKLAQVGYAYDLAHSKAWEHMDKVAKIRKQRDQQKASSCRQQERRRQWERRHISRDIAKKQKQKNGEKKDRKKELKKKEAEEKKKLPDVVEPAVEIKQTSEDAEEKDSLAASIDAIDVGKLSLKDINDGSDSDSDGSPTDTPKSEDAIVFPSEEKKEDVPPISGAPPASEDTADEPKPAADAEEKTEEKTTPAEDVPAVEEESDGDSSDSPVEDWEELYSSDDYTRKPRSFPYPSPAARDDYDTEEEKMPAPWNAVCIVGIRVYSKDSELELLTVMEGGELDGMGTKGQADLDDAQNNAGGVGLTEEAGGSIGLSVE
ncbi:calpain-like protease [Trichoderma guizhouense]|uniref:Calpain-like protease n=1 Tax=Trichoderma guizhouense TaxID=1491466 RepID=A0A1T3CDB8_9HYPO|nr:calpain-like protease [Trichoderma guizhouense]